MGLTELPPEYMKALAGQFGFISAFLGGVSATFMATLIAIEAPARALRWTIGLSGVAAVAFIASAFLSTVVFTVNHEAAPEFIASQDASFERIGMGLGFVAGVYSLLAAIAVAGWHRSRALGVIVSIAATLSAIGITTALLNT